MQFRNTCISKNSVFASTECFRFCDMLFTQCSQNGAQITPAPLKNPYLARPHAGHFFWLLRFPDSRDAICYGGCLGSFSASCDGQQAADYCLLRRAVIDYGSTGFCSHPSQKIMELSRKLFWLSVRVPCLGKEKRDLHSHTRVTLNKLLRQVLPVFAATSGPVQSEVLELTG